MIRSNELAVERDTMGTMVELTSAFEGIASARIAQIREQVLQSQEYFGDLWRIYSQLRVDEFFHFGRGDKDVEAIEKELMILITSEGSFSGDIDQRLVSEAIKH
jgi:F0F1-type ATP synthase gamma subunit